MFPTYQRSKGNIKISHLHNIFLVSSNSSYSIPSYI